jgi:hypothetical protein
MDLRKVARTRRKPTKEESLAYESNLEAEDLPLETPLIAPDELIAGGAPSLMRGLSRSMTSGLGKKLIANEAGAIGKDIGKVILRDEVTNAILPKSKLLTSNASNVAKKVVLRVDGKNVPTNTFTKGQALTEKILSELIKNKRD